MKLPQITSIVSIFLILGLVGCDGVSSVSDSNEATQRTVFDGTAFNANTIALQAMTLIREGAAKSNPRPTVWADGELFGSVVAPNQFKPTAGNFDQLYMGGNGFLNGVPLISEAKPGDQDYNGGRWHVNVLNEDVDPDKYSNADRVEDLDPADFTSTDVYFSCPMLPRRGNN